jgi:hypothetical protein
MVWRRCSTGRVAGSRTTTRLISSALPFEVANHDRSARRRETARRSPAIVTHQLGFLLSHATDPPVSRVSVASASRSCTREVISSLGKIRYRCDPIVR